MGNESGFDLYLVGFGKKIPGSGSLKHFCIALRMFRNVFYLSIYEFG